MRILLEIIFTNSDLKQYVINDPWKSNNHCVFFDSKATDISYNGLDEQIVNHSYCQSLDSWIYILGSKP